MNIIGAGHTLTGTGSGAVGIVNESVEVRKIGKRVTELLKQNGQDSLYLQIDKADSYKGENYIMRVRQANQCNCNMYIEIHLNKTAGANGSEIYTYNAYKLKEAVRILDNLEALGFTNRGIKKGNHLYVINKTKMKSMLIECFFCDSQKDVNIYNEVGAYGIAKAIVEGILGRNININNTKTADSIDGKYGVVTANILNVRSTPSTNGNIIGKYKKDEKVKLYKDCKNGWYEIYFGQHGAFVSKDYIKII